MLESTTILQTFAQADSGGFGAAEARLLVIGSVIGAGLGVGLMRIIAGRTIAAARKQAEEIVLRSKDDADTTAQKAELEADKRILERKAQFEKETEATRAEIREQEKRLAKREDMLDRKLDTLASKEEHLAETSETLQRREGEMHKRE